ncbi:TlpA family protein disulfide reductase [Paraliomyxa miuraensis]|uniref:TlpA family protein disulfide reductase n=1 Tax=Paraliomyxa miuraensis TaxID=376150 RepID=UPI0022554BE3|nr:thioredoxin family protein [Paraliomyxa miuraensis]MCX4239281.1 thioredoxin family protein [Paraliomyxa miuraensis]
MIRPQPSLSTTASLALVLAAFSCSVEPHGPAPSRREARAEGEQADARKPHFVGAAAGDVDVVVRDALRNAEQGELRLVVYVGATWCEPCQAFHEAVERGELDQALAGVRFLEFDSDHDGARLQAADYSGRYIPRFVLPGPDGRGSAQRIEGGIKGPGAVANLMERLEPLLAGAGGRADG